MPARQAPDATAPVSGGMDSIAQAAMQYNGKVPYHWGGGNPKGWDCSGFVNYVLGHDLGYTLPGNVKDFSGSWHGPVVAQYATWKEAGTIKGPPEAGDLCIWVGVGASGHIGFALGADRMISALDPQYGTSVTPIKGYGPSGAPLIYRRVGQVGNLAGAGPGILTGSGCLMAPAALVLMGGKALWNTISKPQ